MCEKCRNSHTGMRWWSSPLVTGWPLSCWSKRQVSPNWRAFVLLMGAYPYCHRVMTGIFRVLDHQQLTAKTKEGWHLHGRDGKTSSPFLDHFLIKIIFIWILISQHIPYCFKLEVLGREYVMATNWSRVSSWVRDGNFE